MSTEIKISHSVINKVLELKISTYWELKNRTGRRWYFGGVLILVQFLLLQFETKPCCKCPWPVLRNTEGWVGGSASVHGDFNITHCKMMRVHGIFFCFHFKAAQTGILGNEKASVIEGTYMLLPFTVFPELKPRVLVTAFQDFHWKGSGLHQYLIM